MPFAGGIGQRFRIVCQRGGGRKNSGCRPDVSIVSQQMHSPTGAVGAQQFDHRLVVIGDGARKRIGRAFDFGIRMCTVFQQKFSDLVVAVGGRRVEGVTMRCDSFLRQIGICTVIEQKLDNFQMPLGGGILQRGPGALVVRNAIGKLIGE